MSGRLFLFLLLLAALTTALTYLHTEEAAKTLSDPGLADLEHRSTFHGWPWGYYAEVMELVPQGEGRVAVTEYTEIHAKEFFQTFILWFLIWLITVPILLVVVNPNRKKRTITPKPRAPEERD